jgi:uncharacterized membrane protein YfhO
VDLSGIDVDTTALVTHPLPLEGGAAGEAMLAVDTPGHIVIDTRSPNRQLLVVSESFDDGWRAMIDEGAVAVERVNGDFMGAVVPAGRHRVTLTFRPLHLVVGRYLSAGGVLIAVGLLFAARRHPHG